MDSEVTKEIDAQVESYIHRAETWFSTLDRTFLGSFAVDGRTLVLRFAYELMNQDDDRELAFTVGNKLSYLMDLRYEEIYGSSVQWRSITVEMLFWWEYYDAPSEWMDAYSKGFNTDSAIITATLNALHSLSDFLIRVPAALPYLEAGISDRTFIERCVNDGIDADIALRL